MEKRIKIGAGVIGGLILVFSILFSFMANEKEKVANTVLEQNKVVVEKKDDKKIDAEDPQNKPGFVRRSKLVKGWQEYVNEDDGYLMSYPIDYLTQDEAPNHIDISSPEYDGKNSNAVRIQIQKRVLDPSFDSMAEYKKYLMQYNNDAIDEAVEVNFGDFVKIAQYTKNSPEGAFMTYVAFDEKSDVYYNILVLESGYSSNKELIRRIIKTFVIL